VTPLADLRARLDDMVDHVAALVAVESPTADRAATRRSAEVVGDLGRSLLGHEPDLVEVDGCTQLGRRR
jgi:glutamate carboxypeptidase